MPRLDVSITTSHPKHPGRPAVLLVATHHRSPILSKYSLRVDPLIVVGTKSRRLPGARVGNHAVDVRVYWGGPDTPEGLVRAWEQAKKHGASVLRRNAAGTGYERAGLPPAP